MSVKEKSATGAIEKMSTGIRGLDDCLTGGLPRKGITLLTGGPGCGKTVLALQTLVNGAQMFKEPGIFVAFEEDSKQITRNAGSFGWELPELQKKKLFFLNAKLRTDMVQSGEFDMEAMLAIIKEKAREIKARRIVFDSVDVLLSLLDSQKVKQHELYRLYDWIQDCGLTAIITAKVDQDEIVGGQPFTNMQFMSDCVIQLSHQLYNSISIRNLWVMKYRGSNFLENQVPITIGDEGVEIAADVSLNQIASASTERVSSGVKRLDTMLNGGYFRGNSVLITGSPGTAKSTLSAAFTDAACKRKEKVLYVSFDSSSSELARNFLSVNIDFNPHINNGRLKIYSAMADGNSSKEHHVRIRKLIEQFNPSCIVIDPLSALIKSDAEGSAKNIAERLILLCRLKGITLLNTSLLDSSEGVGEKTPIEISTIADAWIHLSYVINAGERNRALSIVKARGTKHSNQVRELILSSEGITLSDVYTASGEVLMGTLRMEKEHVENEDKKRSRSQMEIKRKELEYTEIELSSKFQLLEREIELKKRELELFNLQEENRNKRNLEHAIDLNHFRDTDAK